ncbi:MAG: anaerobic sulfatase maturase, partial [Candidatus Marinimicrobia bacterium]|nr:anaerobic sulfatase maturase [Candidatus Neomarinimicrobiota bacterium]
MTRPYQVMAKPAGAICNLNCRYCFYLEKEHLYQTDPVKIFMSADVLESFIRQKLETSANPTESFTWQGGEPTLLDVDYYRKILAIQQKYANGKKVKNAFQTNGILLNDEWCQLFAENDFLIGISIDGPEEIHDHYRIDKGGHPTFPSVLQGVELLKKHGVSFNTLTVVNDYNSDRPRQVYEFLKDIGSQFQQYIPIVERKRINSNDDRLELVLPDTDQARITDWSVKPEQYGKFLIDIFDIWVRNDVGNIFIQLFDVALEVWSGLPASLCIFNKTCGRVPALEHNGDLYSCDHFVFPEFRLGNILEQPLPTLVDS